MDDFFRPHRNKFGQKFKPNASVNLRRVPLWGRTLTSHCFRKSGNINPLPAGKRIIQNPCLGPNMAWEVEGCCSTLRMSYGGFFSAVGKFRAYSRKHLLTLSNSLKNWGKLLTTILDPWDIENSKWICPVSRKLLWKMKRKRKHFCSSESPFDHSECYELLSHFSPGLCCSIEEKIVVRVGKLMDDKRIWFSTGYTTSGVSGSGIYGEQIRVVVSSTGAKRYEFVFRFSPRFLLLSL